MRCSSTEAVTLYVAATALHQTLPVADQWRMKTMFDARRLSIKATEAMDFDQGLASGD